jgi:pyridoxamine 5'-phosphate oxidase
MNEKLVTGRVKVFKTTARGTDVRTGRRDSHARPGAQYAYTRIAGLMIDPIEKFRELFEKASQTCVEPDAMVLSTVDADGQPSGRYVLLKAFDRRGFVFYTNLQSRKARALAANPHAALCLYWAPLEKQVRIEGTAERVSDAEADAYFATRPRPFQIGAWASRQSAPLDHRASLEERVAAASRRFENAAVSRPPFWSGFRVVPLSIEFWTRDPDRLHERERYDRDGDGWVRTLLFP